jgi:PAS domain S-box-containing protein
MIELITIVCSVLLLLLAVHLFAKWQVKRITYKTQSLQKQAESKTKRLERLEKLTSERLLAMSFAEQVANFSKDCIVVADREKILYVNPIMCKSLGYAKEEMVGKNWMNFICCHDQKRTLETSDKMNNGKAPEYFVNEWTTKNGSCKTFWWTMTNWDKNGITYAVAKDISDEVTRKNIKQHVPEFAEYFNSKDKQSGENNE